MQSPAGAGPPAPLTPPSDRGWAVVGTIYGQQSQQLTCTEEVKTLWVGDLQYWMDENYLHSCFAHTGDVTSVKIIRNKQTGHSEGYGFVEFASHQAAERLLHMYHGAQMPNTEQPFRLNWASFGIGERRIEQAGPEHSIFVGDLAPDVTDYMLQETFKGRYHSVKGAKVVTDVQTGRSKGYGFVRFLDEAERDRAMLEMQGVYCSSRPMRISAATPKKTSGVGGGGGAGAGGSQTTATNGMVGLCMEGATFTAGYQSMFGGGGAASGAYGSSAGVQAEGDPNNTTIFVGGLDSTVTEDELRTHFQQYGEIGYVKIPYGKGCGFVQFLHRAHAEDALTRLHGSVIGQQAVRLSWGRSPANKQQRSQQWGPSQQQAAADISSGWGMGASPGGVAYCGTSAAGYRTGYEAYGYAITAGQAGVTQESSGYAYAAVAAASMGHGYGAYGVYQQQGFCDPVVSAAVATAASGGAQVPVAGAVTGGSASGLVGGHVPTATNSGGAAGSQHTEQEDDSDAGVDVEAMNSSYIAVHEPALIGRQMWIRAQDQSHHSVRA
ncbi:hypothetical protein CBR_g52192 [Chara braunii]|uniref:RRM domain-containing protein n=1 Tax=Chara braunii TaxID=69332 RepID=A0A388M9R9_CHABU|nr:hypothetical protein CBR_g52192 [Chara braunii]|eukprot:GBG91306.1 hypothetical protein CBR_g52192 [Chara braunii]